MATGFATTAAPAAHFTPPSSLDLVPLDEPAAQGITIQPPTAAALDSAKLPQPQGPGAIRTTPALDNIPPAPTSIETPLYPSPGSGSNKLSPSSRHPLTRPLSPDLPTKDALYLFSNFASYMRSPNEGAEGIVSNEDFKDTVRLLDYARGLEAQANSNVHILHLKYRFQSPLDASVPTYAATDRQYPTQMRDGRGRLRNPVPQPFSVARDPVIKVDYQENGVFEPLPAQAVFDHISKVCYPPPRLIVVSFVNSIVTQNHVAQLSTWALTSSPPCFVFSPLETRLRVTLPIHLALHHAIPMSMYAQPDPGPSPYKPSPTRSTGGHHDRPSPHPKSPSNGPLRRRHSEHSLPQLTSSQHERVYPRDPIASLTIISTPHPPQSRPATSSGPADRSLPSPTPQAQSERLPLWALAPGMNVLQGSTSKSIGIKLGDFSALNLVNGDHVSIDSLGKALVGQRSRLHHHTGEVWIDSSPLKERHSMLVPPIDPPSRPSTPASKIIEDSHSHSDSRSIRSITSTLNQHLTPPEKFTPPNLFKAKATPSSFPRLARIPHWKRGRKELPEDVVEDLGRGLEVEGVLEGMRGLGMWDMDHTLHADRARSADQSPGGVLLHALNRRSK